MSKKEIAFTTRRILESLFEACQDSESGVVLFECPPGRADYLRRWGHWLKIEEVLQSALIYEPEDDLYGKGIYWNLALAPVEDGLMVRRSTKMELSDYQRILNSALFGEGYEYICESTNNANTRKVILLKYRQKLVQRALKLESETLVERISSVEIIAEDRIAAILGSVNSRIRVMSPEEVKRILESAPTPDENDPDPLPDD